ncbi:MAG TPA: hypothetical protein IAC04_04380 [Candidatus Coprenecus stercoravium]|uniref:Uncharacterized protein n=1 Tax=Candidatus Coprenecus stercoravium TaxID=2840735 RepID=A0A9D2GQH2_9BACT|nr:hypothetical protein [Candidatus Coprenecus stercoravium]
MVQIDKIKELSLLEGENVIDCIEGNAWNDNPNPLMRLWMLIVRIFWLIFGVRIRTYLVVTNFRAVEIDRKTILWGLLKGSFVVMTLNRHSISSVGYGMDSSWFISRKYYFAMANASGDIKMTFKGNKEDLFRFCANMDRLIATSAKSV